jgi:protease I
MSKPALIILAQEGYQDVEYTGTRKGLEEAGFVIVIASKSRGLCRGKLGGEEQAEVALSDVNVIDYDRIAFIGGPGAHAYREDSEAHRIARETMAAGKPLGAICIAPTILAEAGVLAGKHATVWDEDGQQGIYLIERGADYTAEDVTVDGLLVTANGPKAADAFGRMLAEVG